MKNTFKITNIKEKHKRSLNLLFQIHHDIRRQPTRKPTRANYTRISNNMLKNSHYIHQLMQRRTINLKQIRMCYYYFCYYDGQL